MNWIIFFLILYGIFFIAAMLLTVIMYLGFVLKDILNEEKGAYNVPGIQTKNKI